MTRNPENTKYGRCEATSKTTGNQCGRAAIGEHGKCGYHGGKSPGGPTGPKNGNWKHGLTSTVIRDEDRALHDAIKEMSRAQILRETLEYQTVKLFRALDQMEDRERASFWDALAELMGRVKEPSRDELAQLARMVGENDRAMREQIQLIIRNAEKLNKITDGETVTVEHATDPEGLAELKDMAEDLF